MQDKIISGIDIGSSKIATVVGIQTKESDQTRVVGFNTTHSRGVKKGLVVDIEQVTGAVEESVEKAERMAGHKISKTFVSVGGPHINSINSHGVIAVSQPQGEITVNDVDRVIEAARAISLSATRRIIEVSAREYSVDGQAGIKNPIGMSGVRLEVETHLITASTINLKNIERVLTDLGIENLGFVFAGLSSAEAVLTETEKDLGVALVDIGGGKMDICVYVEGALSYSASIGIGARHITNDIAVGTRVSLESAERIKVYLSDKLRTTGRGPIKKLEGEIRLSDAGIVESVGDMTPKTIIDGIIDPRVEEIFSAIGAELEKSGFAKQVPSGIVLTGGGALTLHMIEVGKKILGLPIRLGYPDKAIGLVDEIMDPQYATTVGLLLSAEKHIMQDEPSMKDFNKILKDFSVGGSLGKIKDFFKQFLP